MNSAVFWSIFGNLIGLLFCGGYAIYTFLRQGTHVRGIGGWKSKKEYPKSYYFTLVVTFLVALISLGAIVVRLYTYYYV